jgi:hypothetical protein
VVGSSGHATCRRLGLAFSEDAVVTISTIAVTFGVGIVGFGGVVSGCEVGVKVSTELFAQGSSASRF